MRRIVLAAGPLVFFILSYPYFLYYIPPNIFRGWSLFEVYMIFFYHISGAVSVAWLIWKLEQQE